MNTPANNAAADTDANDTCDAAADTPNAADDTCESEAF